MTELWQLGATELRRAYAARETSPAEVVATLLDRIDTVDPGVGAFTHVATEQVLAEAAQRTGEIVRGDAHGPLHGIPVAIKELFDVAGLPATYGSLALAGRVAGEDAEAVRRLRAAGAIVLGLTRSHEFGWGITTQHQTLGGTRNPWDRSRVPGGSSGGSAAAVATGMVPVALGSDTGGSIRIPAGYCGVAGLKPSYGRVPKRGVVPLAPSLDHVGPIARSVGDLDLLLTVLDGDDAGDPSSDDRLPAHEAMAGAGPRRLRLGVVPDLHVTPPVPSYAAVLRAAIEGLQGLGCEVVELGFPDAAEVRGVFGTIQMAEAFHVHARVLGLYPARATAYGADVRRRLEAAAGVGLGDYLGARDRAAVLRRRFGRLLEQVDGIVTPVAAGGPSAIATPDVAAYNDATLPFRDLVMDYTVPQDLFGVPACAVAAGVDADGIPVGLQVSAARGRENLALAAAQALTIACGTAIHRWPPA